MNDLAHIVALSASAAVAVGALALPITLPAPYSPENPVEIRSNRPASQPDIEGQIAGRCYSQVTRGVPLRQGGRQSSLPPEQMQQQNAGIVSRVCVFEASDPPPH
ncbi:hypothetical protein [Neptunicoccus cionae]|uniref:Uncharacterized protein n=1 Tax=Neptunicoccus cionae TaxID=2035344 RepID=A0A916R2D4_9RHOB|nr:hypothetical protein [Amylibacter cionae]GGA28684.1 hypothetical protein GCM10011498_32270 [Amylibacter cionae]